MPKHEGDDAHVLRRTLQPGQKYGYDDDRRAAGNHRTTEAGAVASKTGTVTERQNHWPTEAGAFTPAGITDPEVIEKARAGELVGWSFGFSDRDVVNSIRDGMPHRAVKDLDLAEVSILDRRKSPAYEGTLITARSEDDIMHFRGEDFVDDVEVKEETPEETPEEAKVEDQVSTETTEVQIEVSEDKEPKQQEIVDKEIDYSKYEEIIAEMKEEK